jgi:IMP dehydrogenase/GMP reductase
LHDRIGRAPATGEAFSELIANGVALSTNLAPDFKLH